MLSTESEKIDEDLWDEPDPNNVWTPDDAILLGTTTGFGGSI